MARKFSLDDLKKVESSTLRSLAQSTEEMVQAIIKVRQPQYVPKNVQVRARIDDHILTGEFKQEALESLEGDPQVESISIRKDLKSPE